MSNKKWQYFKFYRSVDNSTFIYRHTGIKDGMYQNLSYYYRRYNRWQPNICKQIFERDIPITETDVFMYITNYDNLPHDWGKRG